VRYVLLSSVRLIIVHFSSLSKTVKRPVCEVNHLFAAEVNKEWIYTSLHPQILYSWFRAS